MQRSWIAHSQWSARYPSLVVVHSGTPITTLCSVARIEVYAMHILFPTVPQMSNYEGDSMVEVVGEVCHGVCD